MIDAPREHGTYGKSDVVTIYLRNKNIGKTAERIIEIIILAIKIFIFFF